MNLYRAGACSRRSGRNEHAQSIAEFGPTLFILFLVLFFMISMFSMLSGYASLQFACQAAAREAATAETAGLAVTRFNEVANQICGGPFGKFGGVSPQNQSALEMKIFQQDASNPDALPTQVTTGPGFTANPALVYQLQATTAAGTTIKPLFWPVTVPARASSTCVVEHPEGLSVN